METSRGLDPETQRELARCDREIEAMRSQTPLAPAWLVTLGIEDWEMEKRLILESSRKRRAAAGASL